MTPITHHGGYPGDSTGHVWLSNGPPDGPNRQETMESRAESADLDAVFTYLADRFPGATYERTDARTMRVRYATCECDLVRHGLVTSPMLCACSAHNLKENLEQSLGVPVSVAIESSILSGGTHCLLVASLQGDVQV